VRLTRWFTALTLVVCSGSATLHAADADRRPARSEVASFGSLRSQAADVVRARAEAWLKEVGKVDDASRKAFDELWQGDRPVLDKLTDTLTLGDDGAAKLLAEARDPETAAPTALPAVLKDAKQPAFFRANLALAYAKALSNRKVYEEGLEALKSVQAEDVVDPGAFYFTKAVAEHSLMLKNEATSSIGRLLDDVADAPERYRMVAALMQFDMMTWQDKDLGWVARKMDNIQRRLDMSRGGPKTRKMQKEVLLRLDEMIKQMENQAKGNCQCNGGGCPNGGQKDGQNSMQPATRSTTASSAAAPAPGRSTPRSSKNWPRSGASCPRRNAPRRSSA
jgi:hypothetical protein